MRKKTVGCLLAAGLSALALAGHPGPLYENEREFTNLTLGAWTLQLRACRPAGGLEVFSGERELARLSEAGAEFRFPAQEGVEVRFRSLDDLRFALVDGRGDDGGVEFQVGRHLEILPVGGDPDAVEAVVDPYRLRGGHIDLLLDRWPRNPRR